MEKNVVDNLIEKLKEVEGILNELPPLKERLYTMPCIFRKEMRENFLSDWLAFILDPNLNGVGTDPLILLLELANPDCDFTVFQGATIEVDREHVFEDGKRIDLYILIDDEYVIAIENKIDSGEGDKQTENYKNNLKQEKDEKKIKEYQGIYLKPSSNPCTPEEFKIVTYEALIEALKNIPLRFVADLRKAFLFQEFIIHMEEYIVNQEKNMTITEDECKLLEWHPTICDAHNKYTNMCRKFLAQIIDALKNMLDDPTWQISEKKHYLQIYKENWNKFRVHFELEITSSAFKAENSFSTFLNEGTKYDLALHVEGQNDLRRKIRSSINSGGEQCLEKTKKTVLIKSKEQPRITNKEELKGVKKFILDTFKAWIKKYEGVIDQAILEYREENEG